MRRLHTQHTARSNRRGSLALVAVVALLVAMLAMALVLDRLWMEAAMVELTTGAEAAALAASRELAGDDLLKQNVDQQEKIDRARQSGVDIAAQNTVAGYPLQLEIVPNLHDIRFGTRSQDPDTGLYLFTEDESAPTSVRVHAERSRSRWNPIALVMHGLSSTPFADAVEEAEVTMDNHVAALRPYGEVPVPALPLAILKQDPLGLRKDTWQVQVENRAGSDNWRFDAETGKVVQEEDGIPEMLLKFMKSQGKPTDANVVLVDLGTRFRDELLERQIQGGWTVDDLVHYDGMLDFSKAPGPTLAASAKIDNAVTNSLDAVIGQPRIVLLYTKLVPEGQDGLAVIQAAAPVAGRIMAVKSNNDGSCELTFQPSVVTSRTVVLPSEMPATTSNDPTQPSQQPLPVAPNKYIYKLQLTQSIAPPPTPTDGTSNQQTTSTASTTGTTDSLSDLSIIP